MTSACDHLAAMIRSRAIGGLATCHACGAVVRAPDYRLPRVLPDVPRVDVEPLPIGRPAPPLEWTPDAKVDLEILARWIPRFYGRGVALLSGGGGDYGEREDVRSREFHLAAAIHRRLEGLRTGDGCAHYTTLWIAYIEWGPGERSPETRFHAQLGYTVRTPEVDRAWRAEKAGRRDGLARVYGSRRLLAAERAYRDGGV